MRNNIAKKLTQPTRGRGHKISANTAIDEQSGLCESGGEGKPDHLPRPKRGRRVLLPRLHLCPKAQLVVREMDKDTRYAASGKGEPIKHRVGETVFDGMLRPWSYYDHLKRCQDAGAEIKFSALGQNGFNNFYPLHNADDYAEALALAQGE